LGCSVSELLGSVPPKDGGVSVAWAGGSTSVIGGGVISACGIGSGVTAGARPGAFFFLAFILRLPVRFAFFFAPFLGLRLEGKQWHRHIVEAEMVIKLP